jgi:cyclic nucleotide gated channel alpha 3
LADYPEARASLTERGCQLLRKDGLLDESVFASKLVSSVLMPKINVMIIYCLLNSLGAAQQHDSLELGVAKLECTVENLNLRLARLLGEYASSQAKLKQRISKLEEQ